MPVEGRGPELGAVLRTQSSSRSETRYRIFPSTKTYFRNGKRVSWEWNLSRTWSDAWYRNPTTNEVKLVWNSSGGGDRKA